MAGRPTCHEAFQVTPSSTTSSCTSTKWECRSLRGERSKPFFAKAAQLSVQQTAAACALGAIETEESVGPQLTLAFDGQKCVKEGE